MFALTAPFRKAPQAFQVTAGMYSKIIGAGGTVINFYPASFRDVDGRTVSSGSVDISLEEIYRPGEMIANSASTVCQGFPLISGGQINLVARKNGQVLYAGYYGIAFRQPASSTQPMFIYAGARNTVDSVAEWYEPVGRMIDRTNVDSLRSIDPYYQFDSVTNFNWINCDYFNDATVLRTKLTARMPDKSFNPSNTYVWLIFPSINSVSYLSAFDINEATLNLPTHYYVPEGFKFHIVSISNINGNWLYSEQRNLTVQHNHVVSVTPVNTSIEAIREALSKL